MPTPPRRPKTLQLDSLPTILPNAAGMDSKLDSAIEDQFKAKIKSHRNLDDQSISGSAKNGTLVIKGSVKTPQPNRTRTPTIVPRRTRCPWEPL